MENIISKNIIEYRKINKLTQSELAEKLNFTDKSVSKWERGEALPDIKVLMQMCEIFGININDLVTEHQVKNPKPTKQKENRWLITLLSCGLVWLVATICFVLLSIFNIGDNIWLAFIYAIPVSAIVCIVFSSIWGALWTQFISISVLVWSTIISLCLTLQLYFWYLIYIGIPLQVLIILWFQLKKNKK